MGLLCTIALATDAQTESKGSVRLSNDCNANNRKA